MWYEDETRWFYWGINSDSTSVGDTKGTLPRHVNIVEYIWSFITWIYYCKRFVRSDKSLHSVFLSLLLQLLSLFLSSISHLCSHTLSGLLVFFLEHTFAYLTTSQGQNLPKDATALAHIQSITSSLRWSIAAGAPWRELTFLRHREFAHFNWLLPSVFFWGNLETWIMPPHCH